MAAETATLSGWKPLILSPGNRTRADQCGFTVCSESRFMSLRGWSPLPEFIDHNAAMNGRSSADVQIRLTGRLRW